MPIQKIYFILYFIGSLLYLAHCARILAVFPMPSISHQVVFRPLTQELVRRGHEVTVITPDPAFPKHQTPSNMTEIDVHDISYKIWSSALKEKAGNKGDIFSQMKVMTRLVSKVLQAQLACEEIQSIIKKKRGNFDILLIEAFIKPVLIFTHIYKIPAIQVSSLGGLPYNYEAVGVSTHRLLYPMILQQKIYNLTNFEKLEQLYNGWQLEKILLMIEQEDNSMLQKTFGQNTPSIRELCNNIHMLFLNNHPVWTDNQPVPTNVVYIGGIHKKLPEKLPNELHSLLNKSRDGVIYFSLGTNMKPSLLPPTKIQMMIKVFSQLPYDVIWKWDLDSLPGMTDNIKIYKWLPQSDLLRHPKVKLFITQGGLQSTDEAIDAGVPLIGIPMIGDQWYNTEKYEYHKIGVKLDLTSLTEELFKATIQKVIFDGSYRENIKRLRSIMEDEPQTPLERAVWWTEYVLRHGGAKHLRAAGANISWLQYLEIELVTITLLVLFTSSILFCVTVHVIWKVLLQFGGYNLKVKRI